MATNIPEGFAQAAWIINGSYGTGPFVFTVALGVASTDQDFQNIANQCFTAFDENFKSKLSNGLTLQKVTVAVNVDGVIGSVDSSVNPSTGSRSQGDDVIALALLANKQTQQLGRQGRGRMFIPGVLGDEDTGLGGEYTNSAREDFQDRLDAMYERLSGLEPGYQGMQVVLLHADDMTPTPVQRFVLNRKVGVIRKRLR